MNELEILLELKESMGRIETSVDLVKDQQKDLKGEFSKICAVVDEIKPQADFVKSVRKSGLQIFVGIAIMVLAAGAAFAVRMITLHP